MMLYVKVYLTTCLVIHSKYLCVSLLNDHFDKLYHTSVADKQLCILYSRVFRGFLLPFF